MKKILSLDGGGIRGIIPGQVLIALEDKLQKKTGDPNARIADFFDFFAGTSTGGILTCILLCPSATVPGKARFSASEAVDLYVKNGHNIFSVPLFYKIASLGGISEEKYEVSALEQYLKEYFDELKLSELLKPCIIPSYDIERRQTKFFAQHDFALKGSSADFLVKEVCRATSAAPTYFETELVKSLTGEAYACVDGGVFANNPTLCAYSEVRNAKDNPTAKDMFVVSIGTGSQQKPYEYDTAKNWGAVGWVKPVIDIMMSGAAEITDYNMTMMFSAGGNGQNYVRIQPASLKNADPQMDDALPANITALIEVGTETAQSCDKELDRIVEMLIAGPDPVEFGD
jgi:patatin-like phospholipase/acyl hydrolase